MIRILKPASVFVAVAALSACGGSSGGNGPSFAEIDANGLAMLERLDELAPAGASMPTTGTATYQGYSAIGIDLSAGSGGALSEATINADFEAGTVEGRIYNFVDIEEVRLNGELAITDGTIAGDGITGARVDGRLSGDGFFVDIDADADGVFLGDGATGVEIDYSGTADVSNGDTGTVTGFVFGEIVE